MKNPLINLYHRYNNNYQHEFLLKKEYSFFKDCKKILDLGCGDGEFVSLDPKRISGIDNNKKSVILCKKKGLSVIQADATKLPFKSGTFNGIHASHLIEHLHPEGAYTMLKEVGRVLKKDGVFVLSTPLLWEGFFDDFTHIKPYYPGAILRYLVNDGAQKTMEDYPYQFKKVELYYRFRPIPLPSKIGALISNFVYQYKIHSLNRDAYTLVLQKI